MLTTMSRLGQRELSLSTGCPSGGGVLRDYLLRRRRMLKFLGKKRKRQLLRSLSSDPLSEGHPVYRDNFLCLNVKSYFKKGKWGRTKYRRIPESEGDWKG